MHLHRIRSRKIIFVNSSQKHGVAVTELTLTVFAGFCRRCWVVSADRWQQEAKLSLG